MFAIGAYIKIWNVNRGEYSSEVDCSSSVKNKKTGQLEPDFSSKFVKFVGNAHKKNPQPNERVKILNCGVENVYTKDGARQYLKSPRYIVFDFERESDAPTSNYTPTAYGGTPTGFESIEIAEDGSLPF